jgi:hypothetical protein
VSIALAAFVVERSKGGIMRDEKRGLIRKTLARASQRMVGHTYHPERHYMRGPGPKTLSKIGEMYRAETESIVQESLPQHWLDLLRSLDNRARTRSDGN